MLQGGDGRRWHPGLRWFLRLRPLRGAVALIAVTGVLIVLVGARRMQVRFGSGYGIPYATLAPLLMAAAIGTATSGDADLAERMAARPIVVLRVAVTLGLSALGCVTVAFATQDLAGPIGPAAAVRNLGALAGLALMGGYWIGAGSAWLIPTAVTIVTLTLGLSGGEPSWWALLLEPNGDVPAAVVAGLVFAAGIAHRLVAPRPP